MGSTPSNRTIVGVSILLFTGVLMAVGIHHLVQTGTCSSTGYASNYGPVPYCPSGTGWWIGFLMLGIFGGIIGGFIAGGSTAGLINGFIFTAIGAGSLSVVFDKHASSKAFAGVFGGCFFVVGAVILAFVLASAFRSMRPSTSTSTSTSTRRASGSRTGQSSFATATSAFGTPQTAGSVSTAFGNADRNVDPILGAYAAGHGGGTASGLSLSTAGVSDSGLGGSGGSVSSEGSDLDSLSKLADLHKSGALTDEEFAREKAKLLGSR